ncbi:hypothetical protein [Actinoplanes cyaneus]|nr:hypothetical protein [Actinoplanes cyaneus]
MALPPDLEGSDAVAMIYDETDGLGFYAGSTSSTRRSPTRTWYAATRGGC